MEKEFNNIILQTIILFIEEHSLLGDKPSIGLTNNQRKYIFGSQSYGHSLHSIYKDLMNFDIFAPISTFNYYGKNYLIQFKDHWNSQLFAILAEKFLNTSYEKIFYETITKIIPINFCVRQQPWSVVKNFLSIKPRKSNGIPSTICMKEFFHYLSQYAKQPDFENCLFTFCKNNTSFIKRIESQQYLKTLLNYIDNSDKFSLFLEKEKQTLTVEKNDFITFYINKKSLFTHVADIAVNKKQPVDVLNSIFNTINQNPPHYTHIAQLFIEQKDEKFPELIVFIRFKEKINYSFEQYYLYLLNFFLNNRIEISKNLDNVSSHFFLNIKYPEKINLPKQKTTKI